MAVRIIIPRWKIWKLQAKRIYDTSFTLLSMLTVALLCTLITMRLSIHASIEAVPNLAGLTLEEASQQVRDAKLDLTLENRFYSATVPSGRVISQSPAPGSKVRRGWIVRVTESTGPQKVAIPDTVGKNARDAAMEIRHALLELGTTAHIAAPGPADMVLAQTPPPNAEGVDKPQVSVLLSSPEQESDDGWVMPNMVGLSLHEAEKRALTAGLRLIAIAPTPAPIPQVTAVQGVGQLAPVAVPVPAAPLTGSVTSQLPLPGSHVNTGDAVKVMLNGARLGTAVPAASSATPGSTPATVVVPSQTSAPAAKQR